MRQIAAGLLMFVASTTAWTIACSGTTGEPTRPVAPSPGTDAAAPTATGPSDHECDALIAHAVAIGIAGQRHALPPDQVPTDAEQAALRSELRAGFHARCRGGTREGYQCGRAATTLADLAACYSTRSSSTSNSSVAPGGMTPPAPLSP